ncbi:MAG TPA: hypothetical protein VGO58_12840 [Chitinophagaceae bacterium]|jgi:hypothetical protein|nr:hypothetical protein [Chitinophagaceae bacterium]
MKRIFLMVLTVSGFAQTAKADTIDYWHVYYNKIKIGEFTHYGRPHKITLKLDSLHYGDSITVIYSRDTPCAGCTTHLTVEDGKHHLFLSGEGKGTRNTLAFSIDKLIDLRNQGYKEYYQIFYFEEPIRSRSDKIMLFRIKIE